MKNTTRKFDLEDGLADFAYICLSVGESLPSARAGQNLEYQLSKATSPMP